MCKFILCSFKLSMFEKEEKLIVLQSSIEWNLSWELRLCPDNECHCILHTHHNSRLLTLDWNTKMDEIKLFQGIYRLLRIFHLHMYICLIRVKEVICDNTHTGFVNNNGEIARLLMNNFLICLCLFDDCQR